MAFEKTVTAASLAERWKKQPDDTEVARCLAVAVELLTDATVTAFRTIPTHVADSLVIRVARAELDNGRQQNGAAASTQIQGESPVRPPRDPLASVGPILSRYVIGLA